MEKSCLFTNINSKYLLNDIFSLVLKNVSLNVIIYNKKLQKILGISIEDYKTTSRKYIKKCFGFLDSKYNEYSIDTNILVFEGEYKFGKKEGNGKEYFDDGKLKFEGKYHKGKKISGKRYDKLKNVFLEFNGEFGEEKYNNGKLMFEGKYFNGKRWNGIGYDINGNKVFEIKFGRGMVKEYFDDGKIKFEGQYHEGERNGEGIRYDYEGEILFKGEYLNGEKWNGKGKEFYSDYDKKDEGFNAMQLLGQNEEEDNFSFGFGFGLFGSKKKKKKKTDPFPINFGEIMKKSDSKTKYLYRLTKNNFGSKFESKIMKYEGEYLNGKWDGKGKEFNADGHLIYEGEYKDGKWDGYGKLYDSFFKNNLLYKGNFKNGKKHGEGIEYNSFGTVEYEGEFVNGKHK